MRKSIFSIALCCMAFLPPAAGSSGADAAGISDGNPVAAASPDSVTTIVPMQQECGVAHLQTMTTNPPQCIFEDAPVDSRVQLMFGGWHFAWIIWDVSGLPPGARVIDVEIEHELVPIDSNHDGFLIQYRRSGIAQLPLPDCWDAYEGAWDGLPYLEYETDTVAVVCRHSLGGSAAADLADAIANGGCFSLWITPNLDMEDPLALGTVWIPGWGTGSPVLRVTWDSEVAVEDRSWGAIKSLSTRE